MVKNLNLKRIILVNVCMLLLAFSAAAEDISAILVVDYDGDGTIDKTVDHEIAEGSSAHDLLEATTDVEVEMMDWGALVVGIDDVMADWEEESTWWMFEVNGEQSDVSVDKYVLEQSDMVAMSLAGAEEGAITVVLELDYDGDEMVDKAIHHVMEAESTALDFLNDASDLTTEEKEWGSSVVGIDGWMTNWDEEGTWWMFEVNGVQSDVSVDGYVLEDGDSITMSLAGAKEDAITMVLEIDYEGDEMIDKAIHTVMEDGSTALDLLNDVAEVTTEEKEWGMLVIGIDDVATNYGEDGTWWIFEINGVMSELSVNSYMLESGDIITMSLGGMEEAEAHEAATT